MVKFKDYNWVLEGLAAILLLTGFILMLAYNTDVKIIAIRLTGLAVLFFTIIRIRPIISSRNEKDYVLIMFSELVIDFVVGAIFLFFVNTTMTSDILSFSRLSGLVLFLRGVTHFYTTVKRYELHDIISFMMHIVFISFGFLFLWSNELTEDKIVTALIILAAILTLYFSYRSYRGYNNYRIKKTNIQKMDNYINKKEEKTVVIEDPVHIQDQIDPKRIEEKQEDRPNINVN